jgi:hypothetical protein
MKPLLVPRALAALASATFLCLTGCARDKSSAAA